MKKILLVLILIIASACKTSDKSPENSKKENITSHTVEDIVSYLASDELEGRDTGSEGIDSAATYIENEFKSLGIKPYYTTYRDTFKIEELDAFNVVGFIEGNDAKLKDEVVILSAHYDHIGISKKVVENDSISNGANDNASGTATVLALAKHFAQKKNNKRSIMFALFTAEEKGLLGSKHLAERLKSEDINLYTLVNFEMLGVPFTDNRGYDVLVTGYDLSNMAERLNSYIGSNVIGKSEVAVKYNLFTRSDNYAFYEAFKVPCQTISSCDLTNFDFYHHVDDEANKMDFKHINSMVSKMIPAIEAINNTANREIKMNDE